MKKSRVTNSSSEQSNTQLSSVHAETTAQSSTSPAPMRSKSLQPTKQEVLSDLPPYEPYDP